MAVNSQMPALNERAQHLFKRLVEIYIRDGQPVGSRTLSKDAGLELSPATVRNVMADLEDMGLLSSPHTSAGRIPTVAGYRVFVDTLLTVHPLEGDAIKRIRSMLDPSHDREILLRSASSMLSDVTHLAGIVMLPRQESIRLRQVEFLTLSDDRVLVIMVVNDREVQNRVIHTGRRYTQSELAEASNYINSICAGKDLNAVRSELLEELRLARERMNHMMLSAIEMAEKALDEEGRPEPEEVLVAGQTNLMGYGELADMEKLRQLFEAFGHKRDILHLLDQCLSADGVQIFIGNESGYRTFEECSVVTSTYEVDGRVLGVLGVIGPTRMAYDRVIPIVDVTAKLLGAALNRQ